MPASASPPANTYPVKDLLYKKDFHYSEKPMPRWTLPRIADDALVERLRNACAKAQLPLRVVRGAMETLPPAPVCSVHHVPCRVWTAGPNAMPHNVGRRFWKCPQFDDEDEEEQCTWIWEDGSLPFSAESQARFDEWADEIGGGPLCILSHMLGSGCGGECDAPDDDDDGNAADD